MLIMNNGKAVLDICLLGLFRRVTGTRIFMLTTEARVSEQSKVIDFRRLSIQYNLIIYITGGLLYDIKNILLLKRK